jgi:hypothetical protein
MANLGRVMPLPDHGIENNPSVRHRMFEYIDKTGHNHALSKTDREYY